IEWDPYNPPLYEFAPWVDFSTVPDWKPIARYYFKKLNLPANQNKRKAPARHDLKDLVSTLSAKKEAAEHKTAAAYCYVARDVRYGRPKKSFEDLAIRPPHTVAAELRGDCKDQSSLLESLLRGLDIDACIALV